MTDCSKPFLEICREACGADWQQAVEHPFVQALARGRLPRAAMQVYQEQDGLYLVAYVHICRTLANRTLNSADSELFERSAVLSEEGESAMQAQLLDKLGLQLAPKPDPLPTTEAYMRHERHCAEKEPLLVALAAAAPCNLLYADIGSRLSQDPRATEGSHPYRVWLDLYADESVQALASEWEEILNRWAFAESADIRQQARAAFVTSVRFEIEFWQQAWAQS
ncbi:MAG: hypothetical protein JJU20_13295 [Opitutales bacterium]|nr:hypothetical protein [Opitutales bacterium]